MVIYSHSRLENYEQCPLKFKFKHIDRVNEEDGIERFLGQQVHEAIHYIHKKVKTCQVPVLKQVLAYYEDLWKKNYNKKIRIVKKHLSAEDYFKEGMEMIKNYYEKNYPFKEDILGMEQRILIDLNKDGEYVLTGFIDKVVHNKKEGTYEIHDYKSSNWLPEQEELNNDRQLALYSLGIRELYPKAKKIVLKWHFLKHGKVMTSARTDKQLKELKEKIIALINKIEAETEWPARKSRLCDWCGFNGICPEYGRLLPF